LIRLSCTKRPVADRRTRRRLRLIAWLYAGLSRGYGKRLAYRIAEINGGSGLLHYFGGELESEQIFVSDEEANPGGLRYRQSGQTERHSSRLIELCHKSHSSSVIADEKFTKLIKTISDG
jgi:hypothetical protein